MSNVAPTITHLAKDERKIHQRPLDWKIINRLLRYTRPYAARRTWLLVIVVVRSLQLPALAAAIAAAIKGPIQAGNSAGVAWAVAGFLALAVSTQIVAHFRQRLALELGESVVHDLRNELFAHLQRLQMKFYVCTKLGHIISRLTSDVENVRVGVQEVMFIAMVQSGQMLMAALFMLWYDWVLFLVVLGLAPVLAGINHYFRRKLSKAHRAVQESFSRVTATLAESINGIRTTQAYGRQARNAGLFRDLAEDHAGYHYEIASIHGRLLPLLDMNSHFFIAILLVLGGFRVLNPAIDASLGDLIGFFLMAGLFFSPLTMLGLLYTQALTSMAAAERVFGLLDTPPDWDDPPTAIDVPSVCGRVEFRNVSFEYLPGTQVLQNISLVAKPGQTVALVGHTGSGKTTVTNLVAKFYLPTSGVVMVDDRDLLELKTESWQQHLGIMVQQSFLFSGTVMENIRFSRPRASDQEVHDVVEQLNCTDVFLRLPDGFQTQVGERGSNLSLGQRQLVCFARSLLTDPKVLVLDEASSSVDTLTEMHIQQALRQLLKGRTSFVVAHRLSTIREANQILVLDGGQIVERGTHIELLAKQGAYRELYRRFLTG